MLKRDNIIKISTKQLRFNKISQLEVLMDY